MFNGPRAGICFNDGYGGGDIVEGNLVFNMVRETGDHGSFNRYFFSLVFALKKMQLGSIALCMGKRPSCNCFY